MKVDPEIRNLIPPLTTEELAQLEANLKQDGCRDPIVGWKEEDILLDGHNRQEICDRNGIGYRTVELSFPDRSAALVWVIRNQFGRRNLNDFQRADLALRLEPLVAERAKANIVAGGSAGGSSQVKPPQNSAEACKPIETRKEIAKSAGVSHDTVSKVKKINSKADPELKRMAASGEVSINAAEKVSRLSPDEQKEIAALGPKAVKAAASQTGSSDGISTPHIKEVQSTEEDPFNEYHAELTACMELFDLAIQRICSLANNKTGTLPAFTAWINVPGWRKLLSETKNEFKNHFVIGWASKSESLKLEGTRNFFFAKDKLGRKGSK